LCQVSLLHGDQQALLIVSGEIDLDTVQTLRDALHLASLASASVLVDLDNVTYIGAAGLDALVAADHERRSAGCRLQVHTTNSFILKLLTVTGLGHFTPPA
jgi:anti-anti-sigma factor